MQKVHGGNAVMQHVYSYAEEHGCTTQHLKLVLPLVQHLHFSLLNLAELDAWPFF